MPKKFGVNQRSQSSRERNENLKQQAREENNRKLEDQKWVEDDKHILKKQHRKEEKEMKKRDIEAKRAENRALLAAEEQSMTSKASKEKITHFMIQRELEKTAEREAKKKSLDSLTPVVEEEIQHLDLREQNRKLFNSSAISASGIEQVAESVEKMSMNKPTKVTYKEFEARKLPGLKRRISGLRLSQYREMIWNEWKKSPENPMNSQM